MLVCLARSYAAAVVHECQIHSCYSAIDTSLSSPSGCTTLPLSSVITGGPVVLDVCKRVTPSLRLCTALQSLCRLCTAKNIGAVPVLGAATQRSVLYAS